MELWRRRFLSHDFYVHELISQFSRIHELISQFSRINELISQFSRTNERHLFFFCESRRNSSFSRIHGRIKTKFHSFKNFFFRSSKLVKPSGALLMKYDQKVVFHEEINRFMKISGAEDIPLLRFISPRGRYQSFNGFKISLPSKIFKDFFNILNQYLELRPLRDDDNLIYWLILQGDPKLAPPP